VLAKPQHTPHEIRDFGAATLYMMRRRLGQKRGNVIVAFCD
jgi:hypothetical protein